MGPKKIVAKQEVEAKQDVEAKQEVETSEVLSGKKPPVKRITKPKQTKETNMELNESYDTKLKDITERWKVYNKKSETLRAELENVDNETLKLLKELTVMLEKFKESNDNKSNDNTFVLDKPNTSAKLSKKKAESSDSSNDKESSDNDTNSDDDDDIKTKKAQPKSKSKTVTPAKPSRVKAKAPVVPVLNVDDSDSDE
jgi:hypothetical protein